MIGGDSRPEAGSTGGSLLTDADRDVAPSLSAGSGELIGKQHQEMIMPISGLRAAARCRSAQGTPRLRGSRTIAKLAIAHVEVLRRQPRRRH